MISGIDGCGKSLQIKMLAEWLGKMGYSVKISKAYNDEMKVVLRPCINNWNNQNAIMFLFQALHAEQYSETLKALEEGHIVLGDRWDESYLAYHSNFGELSSKYELREELNNMAFNGLLPDLGFILKVPVATARERRKMRGKIERFEDRSDEYYEIIQESYTRIGVERKWIILDGTNSPDLIHDEIKSTIISHLKTA